ncbi:MAG TPA: type IV toxin-antitoxin system AbiEi family antitoxin domain-containing protein, partial [Solirubrobacteraceae bacterium]
MLADLAARSHGVATRAQLLAAGISTDEVGHRVRGGALIRVHRGVYRVGHRAPSVEATYLAAVWACGKGAVLSGRAAAYLWGLLKGRPPKPEVTAPTKREVPGVIT